QTEIVVFDKTGTLTQGVFEVQKVNPIGISEDELLKMTAFAENYSNHPIATSIKKAYRKEIENETILKIEELSGLGVEAKIEGKEVLVGNEKLMQEKGISYTK